ncbi:methyltransferase [Aureococcus anophagefferens]|uniref:Methyltransferase n=1 Tax=Aureococcus anophagefferens TaxID=44056 RepID=A0ABR1GAX8_AURAN
MASFSPVEQARLEKDQAAEELLTVLAAKHDLEERERERQLATQRSDSASRLAQRRASRQAQRATAAPAKPAPRLPRGLAGVVGSDDAAWLAARRALSPKLEAYDDVDGLDALLGGSSDDDDGAPAAAAPEPDDDWAHASGHGDVVWAAGEYCAARILAHGALFDVDLGGACWSWAGCGLPSLAAVRAGADVLATDNRTPGAIFALAARAASPGARRRRRGPTTSSSSATASTTRRRTALLATLDAVFDENATPRPARRRLRSANAADAAVLGFFDAARARGRGVAKVDEQQLRVTESMRDVCQVRDAQAEPPPPTSSRPSLEAPD